MNPDERAAESDRPVVEPADDRLSRREFAAQVARVLVRHGDSNPIVVGLYGEWGSGKTSVLNFVEREIARRSACIIVRYNPWFFTGEGQLLEHFLGQLATALDTSPEPPRRAAANALRKYLTVLKPVSKAASLIASVVAAGAGTAADIVLHSVTAGIDAVADTGNATADALDRDAPSLSEIRDRVSSLLQDARTRVVVFVDDIDRLSPPDIRMVFKLVRLVGDLPYVSYLLAFDPDVVYTQLSSSIGAGGSDVEGRAYLEKIVQVPVPLPKIRRENLRTIALEGFAAMFQRLDLKLDHDAQVRFATSWVLGLEPSITTIRQIKRVLNAADFATTVLRDEVNAVDVILWESLRLVHPLVADAIIAEPEAVLTSADDKDGRASRDHDTLSSVIDKLSAEQARGVHRLLDDLYPRRNGREADGFDVKARKDARICSKEHFEKLVGYGVPQGVISDAAYRLLLAAAADETDSEGVKLTLACDALVRTAGWRDLIWRLRQDQQSLSCAAALRLAEKVARGSHLLPTNDGVMGAILPSSVNGAMFATEVTRRLPAEGQTSVIRSIVAGAVTLPFAAAVIECMKSPESEANVPHVWATAVEQAHREYAQRLSREVADPADILAHGTRALSVFYQWRNAIGGLNFDTMVRSWLALYPTFMPNLLALVMPAIATAGARDPVVGMSAMKAYSDLRAVFDTADFAKSLGYEAAPSGPEGPVEFAELPLSLSPASALFLFAHRERLSQEATSRLDVAPFRQLVLDTVAAHYMRSGGPMSGLHLRTRLRDVSRSAVDQALDELAFQNLVRGTARPNGQHAPTLRGLLESAEGDRVRLVLSWVLEFLRNSVLLEAPIVISSTTLNEVPVLRDVGNQSLVAILEVAGLFGSGTTGAPPGKEFTCSGPGDLEAVINCASVEEFLALRT